jgi:hypothetical protein
VAGAAWEVKGAKEFRSALKDISTDDANWAKELSKGHKKIGQFVAERAKEFGRGESHPVTRHFADKVSGRGSAASARVGSGMPVAHWGAKRRTGWNARNTDSRPQHPAWVGSSWTAGVVGQGPYGINPAIAHNLPQIVDMYGEVTDDITKRAFPE